MMFNRSRGGVVAVAQPAHGYITGQLARAWGNSAFPKPEPWPDICLAAEQHDVGWHAFERAPTLNPETGLPHAFFEVPRERSIQLWREGIRSAEALGRWPQLLIAMHGRRIYEAFGNDTEDAVAFVAEHKQLQSDLVALFRADPREVDLASEIVWITDKLSLSICMGAPEKIGFDDIVLPDGGRGMRVALDGDVLRVDPWPFAASHVEVACDARRLDPPYTDETTMRAAVREAPWTRLAGRLAPF